jgi:hypothetical protein
MNFTGATAVAVGSVKAASFTVTSNTGITFTVPSSAVSGTITVTTPGGSVTSAGTLTVSAPQPPVVSGFTPTSGPWGTQITITGQNFVGATAVKIGGQAATFTVTDADDISATVPASATTGVVAVTTTGGSASSSSVFTVVTGATVAPSVSGVSPASGAVGTAVTLTGIHFTGVTAVTFGGVASAFTVASDTSITTTVPAGATTGTLAVTSPNGTWSSPSPFTVPVAVTLGAVPDNLLVGTTFAFTATVTGSADTAVAWSVLEGASGGTIDASGSYTAPATPGTYHVVATSAADATATAQGTVPVHDANLATSETAGSAVTVTDLAYFMAAYGSKAGETNYQVLADLNGDGVIGPADLTLFLSLF